MATCKDASKKILDIADRNRDGKISTCENARALYSLGNSEEYALKYAESKSLAHLYQDECYTRFGNEMMTIDDMLHH
jgi:hypothetical protein